MAADLGARVDDVLAVVQGQQQPARAQRVGEGVEQRASGFLADADNGGEPQDHQLGLPEIGQLDKPGSVGKVQPGLPDAPRPAQRQGPGYRQEPPQFTDLTLAPYEAIRLFGKIAVNFVYLFPFLNLSLSSRIYHNSTARIVSRSLRSVMV